MAFWILLGVVAAVVLFTVLVVILTLLYNVVSTLVGGIHVTLGDD